MVALDTSILAYAVNRYAPEHARAAEVVEELVNGEIPWALPWPVVHEFLRLVTHPHAVGRPHKPSEAWGFIGAVVASPTVRMLGPTGRHANVLSEVLGHAGGDDALPPGLEVAVILREHGLRELLSADRGMRGFPVLAVHDPVHGETWAPGRAPARRYRVLKS